MEDIGTPQQCQMQCNQESNCKGFAHLFSNQTCWLKQDINQIVYPHFSPYVGPKQCPDDNLTALDKGNKCQKLSKHYRAIMLLEDKISIFACYLIP